MDLLIKPYIIHPVQLFLDYPLAFGALGIGSLLRNQKHGLMKTYLLGISARFIISSISGIIFFMDLTNGTWAGLVTAVGYNFTYIAAEGCITIVILLVPQINKLFEKFKTV